MFVDPSGFSLERPIEEVPRVELEAGLNGQDLQCPARFRLAHPGRQPQRTRFSVEDEARWAPSALDQGARRR